MIEVSLDIVEQTYLTFRDVLYKYKEYIKYLESLPQNKLTIRQREILKKHGLRKDKKGVILPKFSH